MTSIPSRKSNNEPTKVPAKQQQQVYDYLPKKRYESRVDVDAQSRGATGSRTKAEVSSRNATQQQNRQPPSQPPQVPGRRGSVSSTRKGSVSSNATSETGFDSSLATLESYSSTPFPAEPNQTPALHGEIRRMNLNSRNVTSFNKSEDNLARQNEATSNVNKSTSTSFFKSARNKFKECLSSSKKQLSQQGTNHQAPKHQSSLHRHSSDGAKSTQNTSYNQFTRRTSAPSDLPQIYEKCNFEGRSKKFSSDQSWASGKTSCGSGKTAASSVKTKYLNDGASVSSKKSSISASSTKLTSEKSDRRKSGEKQTRSSSVVQMFDLPWTDQRPESILQGSYSGPVDQMLLPHGRGTVVLKGNESLAFLGTFEHGCLVSALTCDYKRSPSEINESKPSSLTRARNKEQVEVKSSLTSITPAIAGALRVPQEPPEIISEDPTEHVYIYVPNNVQPSKTEGQKPKKKTSATKRRQSFESSSNTLSTSNKNDYTATPTLACKPVYALGETARTRKDMIKCKSTEEAIDSASQIELYEQAFLKRSNGLWTVAILADRSLQPAKKRDSMHWYSEWEIDEETMDLEESMLFVIDRNGATKTVQRRHWAKFVRRMNTHKLEEEVHEPTVVEVLD